MQEIDAERRIKLLRGQCVEPASLVKNESTQPVSRNKRGTEVGRERKRRRLNGEDDTDRDMRLVQENLTEASIAQTGLVKRKPTSDAPLTDQAGHINLFPIESSRHHPPRNSKVEAEAAKKKKDYEDQYTTRFANAAGLKQSVNQKPWYQDSTLSAEGDDELVGKDVWGNEDPRRKERAKMRVAADDPMAVMQKGVEGLRQVKEERRKWKEEQDREMMELVELDRRRERRKKRHTISDLSGFSLDTVESGHDERRSRHDGHHKAHRRHRSKGCDRSQITHNSKDGIGWEVGSGGRYSNQFAHT